jgi:hypothetical protein
MKQTFRFPFFSKFSIVHFFLLLGAFLGNLTVAETLPDQLNLDTTENSSLERLRFLRIAAASRPLPPQIVEAIRKTGRRALMDHNSDGWDDLWVLFYGFSKDGRNFTNHIQKDPEGDADGDGVSNYLEMLDCRNPWGKEPPIVKLTPEQVKAARVKSHKAARANDAKAISRFQSILEKRGVLRRGEEENSSTEGDNETVPDSSFNSIEGDGELPQVMLCSTAGMPKVLFSERLSSGDYLLVWEGEDDKLYDVEWSDDLVTWHTGASQVPVVGGVGNWGQFTLARKRFYRITESNFGPTIPSDPEGGDGLGTFGAVITPVIFGDGGPTRINVATNLPAGVSATAVDLLVDGVYHSPCEPTGVANVFTGLIHRWNLIEGPHTVDAIVRVDAETPAELSQPPRGVLRSPALAFSMSQWNDDAIGFRVTEEQIAIGDPDFPAETEIAVDIPHDPQGGGYVRIKDETGNIVREWAWGVETYPLVFRETWNGTDQYGTQVLGGIYTVEANAGGGGFNVGTIQVAAGARTWEALCLMESLASVPKIPANENPTVEWESWVSAYRPPWAANFLTSGNGWGVDGEPNNDSIFAAWGPWKGLGSLSMIVEEIKGRAKDGKGRKVFGLGSTGKWKIHQWQSGDKKNNSTIQDPVGAFVSGQNPFNSYEIGVFLGHGVASAGTPKAGTAGVPPRQPQHYYPLVINANTGATKWVASAEIPKYGDGGKLKWMFLMTCCPFLDHSSFAIYNACKANNTLPFGPGLHVLCGYSSKIDLRSGMGGLLSEALWHRRNDLGLFRDGTVVNAWGHVWDQSNNKKLNKVARAVYWPECKNDTIYGVEHESVTEPQAHASQADLEKTDFSN